MAELVRLRGTYKTLDEQREALYPAEERLERKQQTIGLPPGLILFLVVVAGITGMVELIRHT
jgi:hypothetical protein